MKPIQYSLVAFHLALPALAQYNIDQCTRLIDDYDNGNSTLNATGVESFRFPQQDDWYMSVTLEFMQARNTSTVRDLNSLARRNVFLSVPESFAGSLEANGTDLCFYGVLKGVNATASDDGHSCNGVLSQQCLDAMSNASHSTGSRCPRIELPDECEITIGWTSVPLNLTSGQCTDEMPGVDLPDGYVTQDIFSEGVILPPEEEAFFEEYDLLVQQSLPMVLTTRYANGTGAAEAVCIMTDNIVDGSREPESSPFEDNGDDDGDEDGDDDGENGAQALYTWKTLVSATMLSSGLMLMLS